MGKEPVNILRLKKENDYRATASHHAHELQKDIGTAKWFSDDFKKAGRSELNAQTKEFAGATTGNIERYKTSLRDQIAQELEAANDVVKRQRKQRLADLYARTRLEYEEELNAMGLAFEKHRD
jgi:hypothetical protein